MYWTHNSLDIFFLWMLLNPKEKEIKGKENKKIMCFEKKNSRNKTLSDVWLLRILKKKCMKK